MYNAKMNNYTNMLREHNLKATPQRIAIIDTIYKSGHINIDKLYENIKSKFESISLATIYKNINFMIENLLILEVKLPNQKAVYEIVKERHSHLLCIKCEEVLDVYINEQTIVQEICKEKQFEILQSDLIILGTCKNCL